MASNRNTSNNTFSFFDFVGSKTGAIISVCSLCSIACGVGSYAMKIVKDIELLDKQTEYSISKIKFEQDIATLKFDTARLKSKISDYERRKNKGK